jgi:hypothetical protein
MAKKTSTKTVKTGRMPSALAKWHKSHPYNKHAPKGG